MRSSLICVAQRDGLEVDKDGLKFWGSATFMMMAGAVNALGGHSVCPLVLTNLGPEDEPQRAVR